MVSSIELFTGAGGLALGMQKAGCNHLALIEWDQDSCDTLRGNIDCGYPLAKDWNVIQSDVRLIDYSSFNSNIQIVSGGPPCQPFSLGGKGRANNDHRDMFPEAVRAVRELKPKAFVFENVKGLLRKSFATYFNYILLQLTYPDVTRGDSETWISHLSRLEKLHTSGNYTGIKYNVVPRLLNAADYGVPQTRHRVVIVGFREDLGIEWAFPDGEYSRDALLYSQYVSTEYWERHKIAKKNRRTPLPAELDRAKAFGTKYAGVSEAPKAWRTVRDAIGKLPDPQSKEADGVPNHQYRAGARSYAGHTGSVLDEPSKTIKAGAHGVPGGENALVLDDGTIRYYTVRESARIQTFPDEYLFFGSWTESMRQIGNAVPVQLAQMIGESVIEKIERNERNAEAKSKHTRSAAF